MTASKSSTPLAYRCEFTDSVTEDFCCSLHGGYPVLVHTAIGLRLDILGLGGHYVYYVEADENYFEQQRHRCTSVHTVILTVASPWLVGSSGRGQD